MYVDVFDAVLVDFNLLKYLINTQLQVDEMFVFLNRVFTN